MISQPTTQGVLPPLEQVNLVSRRIALAVARAARGKGVGDDVSDAEPERRLEHSWWVPRYRLLTSTPSGTAA